MPIDEIAVLVSSLGVFVALVVFVIQMRDQLRLRRAEFIVRLEDKYDEICAARMQNPGMLVHASSCAEKNYDNLSSQEKAFYHYCEMVLGFIEMAVYLYKVDGTLTKKTFDAFVVPMIKLELKYSGRVLRHIAEDVGLSEASKALISEYSSAVLQGIPNYKPTEAGVLEGDAPKQA